MQQMYTPKPPFRKTRFILRWFLPLALVLLVLLFGSFCGYFAPQIYHHFWLFPKQAEVWKERAAERVPVTLKTGLNEYRGVMHSHSEVSHDSEATPKEIAAALKVANCQFICMSDHYVDDKADYSLGQKGIIDGILFIRGFEMNDGLMPWGLPDNTVFTRDQPSAEVAKTVRQLGGVTSVSHTEAWRPWDIQQLDAMEIYNIHTDMIDEGLEKHSRDEVLKEFLMNFWSYGDQTLRSMFDEWVLMMLKQKWDQQNLRRKITGIAANDIHQNVGARGIYTDRDTFLLLDTGHNDPRKCLAEIKLNFLTRLLLGACLGPLEPGKELFRIDCDPYERSSRFVNTHLLAKDLTERSVTDAIRQGRAFVAFNMIGDAGGFAYVARGPDGKQVTMGERIPFAPGLKLLAESPLPCRFTLVRNGETVTAQEGRTFEFEVREPGKYRVEAALKAVHPLSSWDAWESWVIANPIDVMAPPPEKASAPAAPNPPKPPAAPAAAGATSPVSPQNAPCPPCPPCANAPSPETPPPAPVPGTPSAPVPTAEATPPAPAPSAVSPPSPPVPTAEATPPVPVPSPPSLPNSPEPAVVVTPPAPAPSAVTSPSPPVSTIEPAPPVPTPSPPAPTADATAPVSEPNAAVSPSPPIAAPETASSAPVESPSSPPIPPAATVEAVPPAPLYVAH
jgi:hypothetical protein